MMERRNAIRGTVNTTFPFLVRLHGAVRVASSIFFSEALAFSMLWENASKTSWQLLASAWAKIGASIVSGMLAAAMLPWTTAMWSANWPREKDFGCGLQASLSPGIRSRTRRVVCEFLATNLPGD